MGGPRPPDLVRDFFEQFPDQVASAYEAAGPLGYSLRARLRRVLQVFDQPGGRVLDIGCGPGLLVEGLAGRARQVVGVDVAAGMVALARRRAPGARFALGDAIRLPFRSGCFDAVVATGLIPFLPDKRAALREMARVLRAQGSLIATFPNAQSPYVLWRTRVYCPTLSRVSPLLELTGLSPGSVAWAVRARGYTEGAAAALIEDCGCTLEAVEHFNFQLLPSPMDRLLPSLTARLADGVERRARGPWRRWLAAGFVVRARRR